MRDNILKVIRELRTNLHNNSRPLYSPVKTYDLHNSNTAENNHFIYDATTSALPSTSNNFKSLSALATLHRLFLGNNVQKRNKRSCVLWTMLIGLSAITLGTLLIVFSPYEIIFKIKTTFTEGGEGFELWQKPPADVYLKVYLFNVTNKEEFLSGKEKLKVQEVGPYIYRELSEHANVTFNHHNGTISAVPKYPLQWIPELNSGKEDDKLMLPNVALLSIANVMAKKSFLLRNGINIIIKQTDTQPLIEQTAKEFMFGYKSSLVSLGNSFLPSWISFDKLGLIDRMYDFDGDVSTTYTGETDIRMSGVFSTYNRKEYLPQWEYPCNKLAGSSDGTKFPSLISPNETLLFFRKSLCRAVPVVATGRLETIDSLKTAHYRFPHNALDNGEGDLNNKCFCREGFCLPSGLLDVTDCYYGFPIALSYPHFYMADPSLREAVLGTNPNTESHETYFYINQETGTPGKVAVRMQINLALQDVSSVSNAEKFSNLVVPLLWTEVEMPGLPLSLLIKFYLLLRVLPIAESVFLYLLLISGVAFITLSICILIFMPQNDKPINSKVQKWCENSSEKKSSGKKKDLEQAKHVNRQKSNGSTNNNDGQNNRELDVYYCSLLSATDNYSDNEDKEEDQPSVGGRN